MGVRYYADHVTTETGQEVTVEIHDALYGGVSAKLKGTGSGWLSYTHQRLEPGQYTEIQSGEVSASLHIQTEAHKTFRNDILTSSEGRFEIYLKFGADLEWKGVILPDLCSYTESFDEVLTVVAKDFTLLKKDLFTLSTLRETIITTVESILSDWDTIITATSWIEANTTSTDDFLRQIYHDKTAFRQFTEADDPDVQITEEEALKWILRSYGLTLKQSGGALRIDQFTAYENPLSVLLSTYNNGFQSQALTDVTQTGKVTIESDNKPNAGIKRVTNTFNHRTQSYTPTILDQFSVTNSDRVFNYVFPSKSEKVKLSCIVSVQTDFQSEDPQDFPEGAVRARIRIKAGQYYWNGTEWTETFSDVFIDLSTTFANQNFFGNFSIETTAVPDDAGADFSITFEPAKPLGDYSWLITQTTYSNVGLDLGGESTESIRYDLTNTGSFTLDIEYPVTYFGDGPSVQSPSALRYSGLDPEITVSSWQRRGGGTNRSFHANLLHEILDPRRGARRVLNGTIKSAFEAHKVLSYDSVYFYYLGGTFDGYTGNWSIQAMEISIQDDEEAIIVLLTKRIQSIVDGLGSVVNLTTRDIRRLLGITNTLGITTVDYDNVSTETLTAELTAPMRSGVEYWILNIDQLDWRDLTAGIYSVIPLFGAGDVVKDYGTGVVDIEEQTIDAPKGSVIVKAPGQTEIDQNLQEERDEDFDERIGGLDGNFTDLQAELDDVLPITETKISDNAISTPKLQANSVLAGNIGAGQVTAIKIDVADLAASQAFIDELTAKELVIRTGGFIQGSNYKFDDVGGYIAGWIIDALTLKSQASGTRIELNKNDNRVSIFDSLDAEVAVMGYLSGLPKNKDPLASWGVADYGFWAKDGDNLVIDGDVEYDAGDWIIKNDGSYLVQDANENTIIRLGTDTGNKGLFLYNATGVNLARFITNEVFVGAGDQSLKYTIAGGLEISGKVTIKSGSNVYDKDEIDTLEGDIEDSADITAARRTVEMIDEQIVPAYTKLNANDDLVGEFDTNLTSAYDDYVSKRDTFMAYTAGTHLYDQANTYYTALKNAVDVFITRYEEAVDSISTKKATDAENNANTLTNTELDNSAKQLGWDNFAAMKAAAVAEDTIIEGGKIRTSLIVADTVLAADILSKNVGISGTLTMDTGGKITNTDGDYEILSTGIRLLNNSGSQVTGSTLLFSNGTNDNLLIYSIASGISFIDSRDSLTLRSFSRQYASLQKGAGSSDFRFALAGQTALTVGTFTTAQRDTLSAVNGNIIYNSSTGTMQGYTSGSWSNL